MLPLSSVLGGEHAGELGGERQAQSCAGLVTFLSLTLHFLKLSTRRMFKKEILREYRRSYGTIPVQVCASTHHFPFDDSLKKGFVLRLVERSPRPSTTLPLQTISGKVNRTPFCVFQAQEIILHRT